MPVLMRLMIVIICFLVLLVHMRLSLPVYLLRPRLSFLVLFRYLVFSRRLVYLRPVRFQLFRARLVPARLFLYQHLPFQFLRVPFRPVIVPVLPPFQFL